MDRKHLVPSGELSPLVLLQSVTEHRDVFSLSFMTESC